MRHNTVGRPMEILLIEDNLGDARLTFEALDEGHIKYRLTWLSDGLDAMDFLLNRQPYSRAPRPDLVLLDLSLPRLDGREILSELKSDSELRRIPVVVLTGSEAQEDVIRSEQLEVESYMTKPVDLPKFLELVRKLNRFWHADMILPTAQALSS